MTYVLCSMLEFDDGTVSLCKLAEGPIEDCERVADRIPAVTYSGKKRVIRSSLVIPTAVEYETALNECEEAEADS